MKGRMFVVLLLWVGSAAPQRSAANDQCNLGFFGVREGGNHRNLKDDSGNINRMAGGLADIEVPVKGPAEPDHFIQAGKAFVSTSDLRVPSRARKEFDKANELMAKQDFAKAAQKLNKAISIYPAYASAYNNLGVLYSRLGETAREREALQKAISLDDRFALAYINVGRMNIAAGDFAAAQTALDKASTFDPSDPLALILLTWAEFNQSHLGDAIATSRRAHALGKSHALVHRVAARAFEQQRQFASAIAELDLFLQEEPTGPRADAARKELETVNAVLQQFTANPTLTERAP